MPPRPYWGWSVGQTSDRFGCRARMSTADPPISPGPGRAAAPTTFDVDEPFDLDGLHALRSTLAAHASELGAPDRQIEALVIVASELATNAIRHGSGHGRIRL